MQDTQLAPVDRTPSTGFMSMFSTISEYSLPSAPTEWIMIARTPAIGPRAKAITKMNRTGRFPASGLYGAFFVKGASRHFGRPLHSILLFDPRREHSSVPTAYFHRRRAQRPSRTALLQRRRRLVLDGREHGGRLPAIGWLAAR